MLFLIKPCRKQGTHNERAHVRFTALIPGPDTLSRYARILMRKTHSRARLNSKKFRNFLQQPLRVRPTTDINDEEIISPVGEVRHYAPVIFQPPGDP